MAAGADESNAEAFLLNDDAPRVRLTIGPGTEYQRSWYLRQPVTLIGSSPSTHTVLDGPGIAPLHCAIINTGTSALLRDLHTEGGTWINDEPCTVSELQDGDLLRLGEVLVQVAVHTFRRPEDQAEAVAAQAPPPAWLVPAEDRPAWPLDRLCLTIGRHTQADIHVDDEGLAPVQALVFRIDERWMIFGCLEQTPLQIAGRLARLGQINDGDSVWIGAARMVLKNATPGTAPASISSDSSSAPPADTTVSNDAETRPADPSDLSQRLALLRNDIANSWRRLNAHPAAAPDTGNLESRTHRCDQREADLDRQDAALRGRLCDLTAFQEELVTREAELREREQALEAERDRLAQWALRLRERERALEAVNPPAL